MIKGFKLNTTDLAPLIRKHLLLNLPYLFFFWLAGKLSQAYRLAPGGNVSDKIVNIRIGFANAFDSLAPSFYSTDVLFGVLFAVVVWFVIWNKKKNAKKFRKDVEHGSARWGLPQAHFYSLHTLLVWVGCSWLMIQSASI